jgi:hypothetical protein
MAVARASALLALLRVAQVTAGPAPPAPADASRFVPPGPAAGEGGFLVQRAPVEHQVADNTSEEMHSVVADGMSEEGHQVADNVSEDYWVADSVSEEFYGMAANDPAFPEIKAVSGGGVVGGGTQNSALSGGAYEEGMNSGGAASQILAHPDDAFCGTRPECEQSFKKCMDDVGLWEIDKRRGECRRKYCAYVQGIAGGRNNIECRSDVCNNGKFGGGQNCLCYKDSGSCNTDFHCCGNTIGCSNGMFSVDGWTQFRSCIPRR